MAKVGGRHLGRDRKKAFFLYLPAVSRRDQEGLTSEECGEATATESARRVRVFDVHHLRLDASFPAPSPPPHRTLVETLLTK